MNFHILTLFPDMVMHGLSTSIIGRAMANGLLTIEAVNIRDYTTDKHKKVDDYPYGGGAGMLMQAQPVYDAWKSVADKVGGHPRTVYLSPQGATFDQSMAKEMAKEENIVFLCGHYEGVDERVLEEIVTDYVSIGDYVLTGGELPAMVMVDAISRMVPGVLTNDDSGTMESFEGNLLEYPQYSRPEEWRNRSVPKVLLSGNQKNIRAWRKEQSIKRTKERRPDLYERYERLQKCSEVLKKQKLLHISMTELIDRGQAELVFSEGGTICLKDMVSGIYFLTAENEKSGMAALTCLKDHAPQIGFLTLHQDFMVEPAKEALGLKDFMTCYQAVYTRKEKLPVTGLYRLDEVPGKDANQKEMPKIRRLTLEEMDLVVANYDSMDDPDYIKDRIEKGWMYGAFLDHELVGFAGMHQECSIGMLDVLPRYRERKIGKALVTYMANLFLECGYTPFGQVEINNEASKRLQASLGFVFSKQPIFFLNREDKQEF